MNRFGFWSLEEGEILHLHSAKEALALPRLMDDLGWMLEQERLRSISSLLSFWDGLK